MESNLDSNKSLSDKYAPKVDEANGQFGKDLIDWKKMLEAQETATKTEFDWYSTETFQIFLDALDIGSKPVSKNHVINDKSPKLQISSSSSTSALRDENENFKKKGFELETDQDETTTTNPTKRNLSDGTILSAEALKILSELPDLSYMTSSRSFIFPNNSKSNTNGLKNK